MGGGGARRGEGFKAFPVTTAATLALSCEVTTTVSTLCRLLPTTLTPHVTLPISLAASVPLMGRLAMAAEDRLLWREIVQKQLYAIIDDTHSTHITRSTTTSLAISVLLLCGIVLLILPTLKMD